MRTRPHRVIRDTMKLAHVRHFWLAAVVLAAVLALLPFSFHAERHLETATRIEGSEASKVPEELASRFRSPFVDRVVLVVQGLPAVDSEEGEQALATIEDRLKAEPGVSGVVSRLDFRDPIFLGKGGGTLILVELDSTEGPVEALVPKLHELANSLQNQLRSRYPAVKLDLSFITRLWPRRLGLVDEQKGLVYAFPMFQHRGAVHDIKIKGVPGVDVVHMNCGTSNLQAGEIFKIRGGKIHEIEAMGTSLPYGTKSPWD